VPQFLFDEKRTNCHAKKPDHGAQGSILPAQVCMHARVLFSGPPARGRFPRGFHGQRGCRRVAMGRRGQGQDCRLAVGTRRRGGPLPGRPQCRPHAGHRRCQLQAVALALRRRASGQARRHRQWRGDRPACAGQRNRPAGRTGRRRQCRQSADCRQRHADPVAAPRARRAARGRGVEFRHQDRHHAARHRAGLRGQGRPPRDPGDGSRQSRDAAGQGRPSAHPSQRAAPRAGPAGILGRD
jgi:hypothetical protein